MKIWLSVNSCYQCQCIFSSKFSFKNFFSGKLFTVIKSQMDMLGSASLVHAGLTDLSGLEGLGDHLSHHHHAAAAAHHHYYAQVSRRSLVWNLNLFYHIWVFHPIFVTWFLVVFGDQITKILHNSVFTFFTEQGKMGKMDI